MVQCLRRTLLAAHRLGLTVSRTRWSSQLSHTPHTHSAANNGPLQGLRVVDLTRILAGPFCTQILGDLGADVIKVEHPTEGDDTRKWGPPFKGGESAYFLCANRNKRSVAVNLKTPEGVQIVRDLVRSADVFAENFLPGTVLLICRLRACICARHNWSQHVSDN